MNRLDHFVIAAANLEQAKEEFADLTGCMPVNGGAHTGLATCNALVSFGDTSYLEIIAPDPTQRLANNMGAALAKLQASTLLHWAVRVDGLSETARRADSLGLTTGPIRNTSRLLTDNTRLDWQLMGIGGHQLGGLMPFYIDWLQCPHPSNNNPVVGKLSAFNVTAPAGPIHALLAPTDDITLQIGDHNVSVTFESARGEINYQADQLEGFLL